jgi:2-polyprenyl-6-methoxyphenol hydroxylase-like FAD-dependent oxidoreductase
LSAGATLRQSARVTAAPLRDRRWLTLAGGEEVGPFDLVLDTSGTGSPLSPLRGRDLPYGAIWGTVPWLDATPLPPDRLTQRYYRASRMAGILPIGTMPGAATRLAAIFWSLPVAGYEDWRACPLDDWKAEATHFWPDFAPFLTQIRSDDDMTMARYSHGTLARPYGPRLAILGDAAHRASPQLGQGANMALLDAAALAQALATHGAEEAPAEYARLRRWHVRAYQAMSAVFTPQYQSASRLQPMLRDRFFAPLTRLPPFPATLTRIVCGDILPPLRGTPETRAR